MGKTQTVRFSNPADAIHFLSENLTEAVDRINETTIAHNALVKEFTALRTRVSQLERLLMAQNRILQENGLVGME